MSTAFNLRRRRPTIALCMIMRDEERVLDACLTSVKPWFENIYIVDTGSVDRSVEIAESHGAIVSHRPWDFSFSNARNASLDMTRDEDFVCWVDCDDVLPAECGEGLHRVIAMAETRITGFLMQVHIPSKPGGEEGFSIVDHVKVFRNNWPSRSNPIRFEGKIHEQILQPINENGGAIARTNVYVIHAGYDYSDAGQAKKRNRDYTILAIDESERPLHPFPKFNYGMTYYHHQEYDLAIQKLRESLDLSKQHESTYRKTLAMLAGCYEAKQDLESARQAVDIGLAHAPTDSELLFRAANLYGRLGDLGAAEKFYLRLFNRPPVADIDSLDITITTYKGRHNYGLALMDMNRLDDAEAQFRTGLAAHPNFAPTWHALGELFMRRRRFEDARAVLQKLEGLNPALADALRVRIVEAMQTSVV
jgi:glycosyltransferase involved in cell wall biosynthesis